ncbi:hypothetical protein MTR67_043320 [Solanum verrucosum]|uniref:Uncharacterized protein n=1 Tax=Solanum verrucosum TaxID=315347 RepID=A0AAF0UQ23_SOLVR|nr:hypothetical protein MTR67_043320 [Solanum verrucosum]
MDNEIQKLKTNEDNLKSKASQQHDYKNAELRRPEDEKNPELKGDDGKLLKTHNVCLNTAAVESSNWAVKSIKRLIEMLNSEENPRVLVNTFDALEFDTLRILKHVTMVGIEPSIRLIFLDDDTFLADMIEISSKNYMDWLNLKDKGTVIYIAFDSYFEISSQLMEEIGHGLLKCGRPFVLVIREGKDGDKMEDKLSYKDEHEKQGKISTESEVPIVACPLWNDQFCNAKLIQDIWKNGVRVNVGKGGVIERDEFNRCITITMGGGEEGKELRNAKKWSDLDKEAIKKTGTSSVNLKAFANEIYLVIMSTK